jgi:hypothetical protein
MPFTPDEMLSADEFTKLPTFDDDFDEDERLPARFEIAIKERLGGQAFMKWNGVFIGDPLTDNRHDPDGYRFHDVFHFAHAAVLHWSPAFRGLIMHKRKSEDETDEVEDGGRAIVVEEGLTNWLFSRAKEVNFFEGADRVPAPLLKTISEFVRGYEVEACPTSLWESAILQGYAVFREVNANKSGIVVADRERRRVQYRPLPVERR